MARLSDVSFACSKSLVVFAALFGLLTFASSSAFAEPDLTSGEIGVDNKIGLGLGGGTMTSGVTGKFYLTSDSAVQLFVGSVFDYGLGISADYILEFGTLAEEPGAGELFWGAGAGGGIIQEYPLGRSTAVGINGVVELGWHFSEIPLELIVDYRPTFIIGDIDHPVFDRFGANFFPIGFGAAIRFYF